MYLEVIDVSKSKRINQIRRGAPGGIRTHDPRIRNPVLYPAELRERA